MAETEPAAIVIRGSMITLGQFLKLARAVDSGGIAKALLADNLVRVNGEVDVRRGRKLYDGDLVEVEGLGGWRVSALG